MASSSSSSSPSSSSEYITYSSAPNPSCRPFRVITPASSQHNSNNNNKRKRDLLDSGQQRGRYPEMNQFRVVVRQPLVAAAPGSSFGPTGKLKAKPPKSYTSSPELLAALAKSCLDDPEVDFSGSYPVSAAAFASDGVSDKQRVQTVTNDVWKATGYRFTVKDHPPTDRGHKTRLWCSQDEARRSKHRGSNANAASIGADGRVSKQGEAFAKQRYPCRSRLMITCLPAGADKEGGGREKSGARDREGARLVTVRMHHYVRHEAY
ncbi:hypothetical protein DFH08DRAFT_82877, partial [Mycena albidolilacea]